MVSPAAFTENTGLAIVCPITSRVRPFPTSVVLPSSLSIAGEILTSHIRSIDTQARPIRYAGLAVPDEIAAIVKKEVTDRTDDEKKKLTVYQQSTHPERKAGIQQRMENILQERNPA